MAFFVLAQPHAVLKRFENTSKERGQSRVTSEMAMSKRASKRKADRFDDSKFVNYELSEEERAACKAWLTDISDLDDVLLKTVESGYKLSTRFDTYSSAFAAFLMPDSPKCENQGIVCTGRGSTPLKAVKQVLFKHVFVFDGVWSPWAQGSRNHDIDD